LDLLSEQVGAIAEELRRQRQSRERWSELVTDLTPVTKGVMDVATRELGDLSEDVSLEDAVRFLRTTARELPRLEALMAQLDSMSQLVSEVVPLVGPGVGKLTDVLQQLDDKGYFMFAQGGMEIADKVVTSFDHDDVVALGDNVVLILNTVKEMTQPEVMGMLKRTFVTVQEVEEAHTEPPSMFALIKEMRDPQTRRGLARVMSMLRTVGEEQPESSTPTS
ncbi:MAG TPA: DUF1641 domain-containing protein, partial [Actinomycetes bacterium]